MSVAIIGTGYVGLVTGTCLAETGHQVICMDSDIGKVESLQRGEIPIFEPGLSELVISNHKAGRLKFSTDLRETVNSSRIVFVAVGTPASEDGASDLSAVQSVCDEIADTLTEYRIVVLKSTVPIGTGEAMGSRMRTRTQIPFDIVSNPEFLREGQALEDFMKPDRVVIGADVSGAAQEIAALYAPFVLRGAPVLLMDSRSAEMVKYTANAMLACRISFMNEIANACEHLRADINSVRNAIGMDGRIGSAFLYPGVGYGGSCFPKDVSALAWISEQAGYRMDMVEATAKVNNQQARRFCDKVVRFFRSDLVDLLESTLARSEPIPKELSSNETLLASPVDSSEKMVLAGRNIAVWGLSFKPRTDDMRDAPSSKIIPYLLELGANITAYDPVAADRACEVLPEAVRYASDPYDALEGMDALLLLTEWNLFRHPDFERMKKQMRIPVIFDGRNQYSRQKLLDKGFVYFGVGH